jgi:hypothetical protein
MKGLVPPKGPNVSSADAPQDELLRIAKDKAVAKNTGLAARKAKSVIIEVLLDNPKLSKFATLGSVYVSPS